MGCIFFHILHLAVLFLLCFAVNFWLKVMIADVV